MVGVAGGSRGCARCRRRKVKCDQTRPSCERCVRAGLECYGYPDNFLHDPRSFSQETRSQSKTEARSRIGSSPETSESSHSDQEQLIPVRKVNSMVLHQRNTGDHTRPQLLNSRMQTFLNLEPFSDDICVAYSARNLLKGASVSRNVKYPYALPGLDYAGKDGLARDCLLALCRTYFGQQHNVTNLVRKGNSLYGTALSRLNAVLGDPRRNRRLEVFEAIVVMSMYELLVAKKTTGWVSHCLGLEMLFKSYGPGAFNSPTTLGFFENTRSMIISAAMLATRPTILSEPDWKTIPWSDNPEDKSDVQHLYDIMADIPEIVMQTGRTFDSRLVLRPESTMNIDTLYLKSVAIQRALDQWRRRWFNRHYEDFFETFPTYQPSTWLGDPGELNWKTCWHFDSLYVSIGYITYHALLIILLFHIRNCETSGQLTIDHPYVDRDLELYTSGIEICRCVDFHLAEGQKGAGSLFLLMPARCAWKALGESSSSEGRWLEAVMRDVSSGERGRWAIASGTLGHFEPRKASPMSYAIWDNKLPVSPTEP